jgi:carbonic anhydrase/acetyltransferase-like protein (isoleucine patch superfamily)
MVGGVTVNISRAAVNEDQVVMVGLDAILLRQAIVGEHCMVGADMAGERPSRRAAVSS